MTTIQPGQAATAGAAGPTPSALSSLGSDGFLQLLVAQLRYQNPMAPSDPNAILQQTSALSQVEMMQQLAASQQQLLALQQTSLAGDLLGEQVTATRPDGTELAGTVEAIRFADTGPVVVVGGEELALGQVRELRDT